MLIFKSFPAFPVLTNLGTGKENHTSLTLQRLTGKQTRGCAVKHQQPQGLQTLSLYSLYPPSLYFSLSLSFLPNRSSLEEKRFLTNRTGLLPDGVKDEGERKRERKSML